MPLLTLQTSLHAVGALGDLVHAATMDATGLKKLGIGPDIIAVGTSGAIVLCVARFEQFLKDIAEKSLSRYELANPAIKRSQLDVDLQLTILFHNIQAARRQRDHGVRRSDEDIRQSMEDVAARVEREAIWGDHAIDTQSNPGPETITQILKLLGVAEVWPTLEGEFTPRWQAAISVRPELKSIPRANDELRSVMGWRHIFAHTGGTLPIGSREIRETIAFIEVLAATIEAVLQRAADERIVSLGSVPAPW